MLCITFNTEVKVVMWKSLNLYYSLLFAQINTNYFDSWRFIVYFRLLAVDCQVARLRKCCSFAIIKFNYSRSICQSERGNTDFDGTFKQVINEQTCDWK